ncbi:bifunctional demethylmenaquinone methyltransferase/2-methoxy-6-polyprenyl-1,4-benzoquinol methylase UbiE [uncultured Cytophaga sp.]|uniref:bifunctional demethylmenaquinone methyltransferase/2-methoxy-6-polyprenyl-1,4-benzoquinol methylase UbiE n=1 Tax=uncultured Cytophaga sp. TaxID=160238 RepID=UPI00262CC2F1|nr:bifunctional demethylmenaquinone methyltransferase/2-methoxy-6-polyprenyl-1,4-benzoquinol methylase UbiE [uncultured Cytophaga sp.]
MSATVKPYQEQEGDKREQVELMFNNISPKYDLLNRVLSLGIDKIWRKQALNLLKKDNPTYILDVATGTADLAIEAATRLKATTIVGIDIAENMLQIGREKIAKKQLDNIITLQKGDSEKINFEDNTFDAVIVSFGVRNFQHLEIGLSEIYRVLKPGGNIMVLEFSKPQKAPFKQLYQFYFKNILPVVGKMVSKDTAAYTYLPDSVNAFPDGKAFCAILEKVGFSIQHFKPFTFGVCTSYVGKK